MMGAVVLTEVICDHPSRGSAAFGLTFSDRGMASQFARRMRRAGYLARLSPEFETEVSLAAALASAASYFDHPELNEGAA